MFAAILDAIHQTENPVVVFDLDHTLFDNGPRTWKIIREFAEDTGNTALVENVDKLSPLGLAYQISDTLDRLGALEHQEAIMAYWLTRFFTDEYQVHDVAYNGAARFVQDCFVAGATVVYLTGRDAPGMLVGCMASLRDHDFPVGLSRTVSVLKPDFKTPDLEFKTEAVRFISGLGTVVAAFDNEPAMCNLFIRSWPKTKSVLLETAHAPNPPSLDSGIDKLSSFAEYK